MQPARVEPAMLKHLLVSPPHSCMWAPWLSALLTAHAAACPCCPLLPPLLSATLLLSASSKVVRKSIARVHTVYRANIREALRNKISTDGANKKGKVRQTARHSTAQHGMAWRSCC